MELTYTRRLADFLESIRYEDLPQEVVDQVKKMTLHVLGASIGALGLEAAHRPIQLACAKGGAAEATVWGSDGSKKVPASEAAFANGTLADFMDWEDCSWTGHPSAGLIPCTLAQGEKMGASGKAYITAVATGFEGYERIAMSMQPTRAFLTSGHGWGLASWQIFAASLPVGKLLGFTSDQFNQLLGASEYTAIVPSNRHSEGLTKSDIYHYCHGFNARNGIVAAEVTLAGFDNLRDCLDGNDGFWRNVSDQVDMEWVVKEMGTKWYITETYFKHWPSNMWVQTPLEAMDRIMKRHPFTLDEVAKIRVSPPIGMITGDYSATTRTCLDAQFSIPYCLTAYIMDPRMGAHWFTEDMLNNRTLIDFAENFEYFGEPRIPNDCFKEFEKGTFPEVTVKVYLKDGTELTETMRHPKGHPRNNFTMEEEFNHFRMCCKPYMKPEQIEKIISLVAMLEDLENIGELAELGALH